MEIDLIVLLMLYAKSKIVNRDYYSYVSTQRPSYSARCICRPRLTERLNSSALHLRPSRGKRWPSDPATPRSYTIVIPTVASHGQVSGYPEGLVEWLAPDYAVLAYWEDFFPPFTSDPAELRSVRLTDPVPSLQRLTDVLGSDRYTLPAPMTEIRFANRCP